MNILCVIKNLAAVKNENPQGNLESEKQSKLAKGKEKDIWEN